MLRTQISLTTAERALLDAETKRTGRSMSALIREAVVEQYGRRPEAEDLERDRGAFEAAFGSWRDRDFDGKDYIDRLRTGARWADVLDR